jgi:hypothetical protein
LVLDELVEAGVDAEVLVVVVVDGVAEGCPVPMTT